MGKNILITGSSRGIGKETALYIAKNNSDVEIVLHCNKNISKAGEVKKEIELLGNSARILQFDVSDRKQCHDVISKDIEDEIDKKLLKKAMETLTDREKLIISLRFGLNGREEEKTQKEVADMLGISQSYISRLEKKIIHRLKKEMIKME